MHLHDFSDFWDYGFLFENGFEQRTIGAISGLAVSGLKTGGQNGQDVPIQWKEGEETYGRALGNHVAWMCKCDHLMLGPHEELYFVPACPTCGRKFRILKGKKPRYVKRVIERVERPVKRT
jgi:hypothetical protein